MRCGKRSECAHSYRKGRSGKVAVLTDGNFGVYRSVVKGNASVFGVPCHGEAELFGNGTERNHEVSVGYVNRIFADVKGFATDNNRVRIGIGCGGDFKRL